MSRNSDLRKLVKLATDAHEGFNNECNLREWGTPKSLLEKRWYDQLMRMHHDTVEGRVSFSPLRLYHVRVLTRRYLRRFDRYRLPPN
jgi:hypothetical protein